MTAPLIFLDCETTGLEYDADIWEFAAIRREPDGTETEHHYFVRHSTQKCNRLPQLFLTDHQSRFPASHDSEWHRDTIEPWKLADHIAGLTEDRPHIVGAVPNFDTERLALLLRRERHIDPGWHYHLIDVENLAVGYLAGMNVENLLPPWDSEDLSRGVGVEPNDYARHTAMGDAQWARAVYDAVMGGAS